MPWARVVATLASVALIAACARLVPGGPVAPVPVPPPLANAVAAGVTAGPELTALPLRAEDAGEALASFRETCPKLLARVDSSMLTRGEDWRQACDAAAAWATTDARRFFATQFETVRVGDGSAFVTGYYEPEIAGVRVRQPGFDVPILGIPPDLARARPGDAAPLADGPPPLGRAEYFMEEALPTRCEEFIPRLSDHNL